ncbi:sugar (pentulose and hexulose) kinases [Nannochloropsis oceanica]
MPLFTLPQRVIDMWLNNKHDRVVLVGAALSTAGLLASALASYRLLHDWNRHRYLHELDLHEEEASSQRARIGVAVDIGSSSVRCSAYVLRRDGGVAFIPGTLAQVKRDAMRPDGTVDAICILQDVESVLDACLCLVRGKGLGPYVAVVGFAAFVMNLVGVDREGSPITPVLTYADRHPTTGMYVERLRKLIATKAQQQQQQQEQGPQQQQGQSLNIATAGMTSRYYQYVRESSSKATKGVTKTSRPIAPGSGDEPSSGSSNSSGTENDSGIYNMTGAPIHTAYAAPQLCRLAEEEPDVMIRVFKWQSLVSFCLARWTGATHLPVSYSEASWTGLLDFRRLEWCAELTSMLPIQPLTLPSLADYQDGPHGRKLTSVYARRWPELTQARFFLGVGDGACANIGSGCRDAAHLAVTIGTSAAARVVISENGAGSAERLSVLPVVPPGLWCYRIDKSRLLLGGALTDGGSLIKWMMETFRVGTTTAAAEAEARQCQAGGHGLMVLPFLSGERSPGWNPDAKATITGLTKHTTGADIYRAGLESVALRLAAIVSLMAPHLRDGVVVGASGTALECSPLWRQILADVLGMEVRLGKQSEATSLGAAILMSEGFFGRQEEGGMEEGDEWEEEALHRHVPAEKAHTVYMEMLKRQDELYEAMYPSGQRCRGIDDRDRDQMLNVYQYVCGKV